MNLTSALESAATVENAGGQYYLTLPYISAVGSTTGPQVLKVPIKHELPSAGDRKALLEAATVQGGLGAWTQKDDGSIWLVPTAPG